MPCATAERTTARSRSELIAMMSGAGPDTAQRRSHVDAAGVGQSDIQQHKVDRRCGGRGGRDHAHRTVAGTDGAVHHETRHPLGVLAVRLGDQRFVLDDQDPDHERAATGAGMVAVITEP